jgi:hypothetical protein
MAGFERQRPYFRREAPPDDKKQAGGGTGWNTGEPPGYILPGGQRRNEQEIQYDGTPTVTVRLVNGIQQDVPHLYVDSRGGQTRWWVERESIESWQERVRAAKESGDERYRDISPDDIPSSITHNFPNIPPRVLQNQPEYTNREWVTLSYSLTPNDEGEMGEHTFLNSPASSEEGTTIFSRKVKIDVRREVQEIETESKHIGEEGRGE